MSDDTKSEHAKGGDAMPRGPVAIDSVPWTEWGGSSVRFGGRSRVLSNTRKGGGRRIGIAWEELPPGRQSCPFHYHMLEEEHIIAMEGEAILRLGNERYPIKAGDYVAFPAGQQAGHCLVNEGDKPFRFFIIGDHQPNEVCVYPDSNKLAIGALGKILRDAESLDYWDGERAGEPLELAAGPSP
jgi:uncharacterized cupin superfamily protein